AGRTPFTSSLTKQSSGLVSTKTLSIAIAKKVISSLEKVETNLRVFGSGLDGELYN
ncbi:unnamed protein product, partial [Brassica rapa subsp. narinosa]